MTMSANKLFLTSIVCMKILSGVYTAQYRTCHNKKKTLNKFMCVVKSSQNQITFHNLLKKLVKFYNYKKKLYSLCVKYTRKNMCFMSTRLLEKLFLLWKIICWVETNFFYQFPCNYWQQFSFNEHDK